MRGGSWRTAVVAGGLVAAVALTFANAIPNGFVLDDLHLIVHAPGVQSLADTFSVRNGYRPLRTLSYRLDYAIAGMDPWIFHLSNVAYHGVTTLLVLGVLRACGVPLAAAGFGAVLFAVHPVQADAVSYASGRRDVLCGLFFAAGLLAYLRYRRRGGAARLAVVAVAFVLALLAKEMAVTLPLLCWLYDRWPTDAPAPSPPSRWPYVIAAIALAVGAAIYGPYVVQRWDKVPWHGGARARTSRRSRARGSTTCGSSSGPPRSRPTTATAASRCRRRRSIRVRSRASPCSPCSRSRSSGAGAPAD
jgi:hypothetical protein